MTLRESRRMGAVRPSHIPAVAALLREYPEAITLGQGVVHYGPPDEAREAIGRFFADPSNHKYKAEVGIPPLIDALRDKLEAENGFRIGPDSRVVVTAGSNMGFLNAVLAVADPGDEVIVPVPYYFNHEMALTLSNVRPVLVPTGGDYQLRVEALEAAITPRTRAILTVSPNNPTGVVLSEASLRAVNELCRARGLYHVSDEAYEYFVYDGARHFSPGSLPGSAEHTISLFTLSKTYGFASWRIGCMVIPEHLYEAVKKVQETNVICPPVISQFAALGALEAGAAFRRPRLAEMAETRRIVLGELEPLRGLCDVSPSNGAIYLFLRVDTDMAPMTLVERLIREHGVAVMPGTDFGMTDGCYLRLSYGALPQAVAAAGVGLLVSGLKAIVREAGDGAEGDREGGPVMVLGLQLDTVWEDKAANHAKLATHLRELCPEPGTLVVLPEMWATGFSLDVPAVTETPGGETRAFLDGQAKLYGITLLGGVVTTGPDGRGRNEAVAFGPDGVEVVRYTKMHPFSFGLETTRYGRGGDVLVFGWQGMTVAPFVCYDLRFPEVFRHAARLGAELFCVIANWPQVREDHWMTLLKARAIENQAYVVGVNRCGHDPSLYYGGRSLIFGPRGEVLADGGTEEGMIGARLDPDALRQYRREFPALDDIHPDYQ